MATKPPVVPQHPAKIKLTKEQKHYVAVLEQVDADIKKKTAALDRATQRVAKAQREAEELKAALGSLDKMKKGAEEYLSKTPPPPQWEQVFKYEYHYHYHQPWLAPVIYPTYPPPYYTPWWSTVTCQGNLNVNAVKTIVTNCGALVGGSVNLNTPVSSGTFQFSNSNASFDSVPLVTSGLNSSITVNSSNASLPGASGALTFEVLPLNIQS